jgi:predicted NUDIX family NTP pyrophosphohydrolase
LSNNGAAAVRRPRTSAGLLLFRRTSQGLEFLLVHPGGPFFARKDDGSWTIPKGEPEPGEDLLVRARIEFAEELGFSPGGDLFSLGTIRQKGGKTVHAWASEGDLPKEFVLHSNTFELEWPPRSGRQQVFPEVDRAEFFSDALARQKINPAQVELLDRLVAILTQPAPGTSTRA